MKSRSLLLIALLASAALLHGQGAPTPAAAPATPAAPAVASTPASATPEVKIKDAGEPTGTAVKSGKDSTGHDTLSVDFPDEDIRTILRNTADLFELNLVIPETLQGKTSVKLRDVSWRQIFQVVLAPVGYSYIEDGNIIKIVSNESLQQEPTTTEVFILNYARAADILATVSSLVDTAGGGKIVIDARSNSLVITERPSRVVRIRPIIESLDRATDQVMIESKFIEVSDSDIRNIGMNWSTLKNYKMSVTPGAQVDTSNGHSVSNGSDLNRSGGTSTTSTNQADNGGTTSNTVTSNNGVITNTSSTGATGALTNSVLTTTTGGGASSVGDTALKLLNSISNTNSVDRISTAVFSADQFGVIISALTELNRTKLVSNPTIVTLNNTEAMINVGQEYPIPNYTYNQQNGSYEVSGFTYKPIGVILKVTPQVNARGFVKLNIEPEVSSIADKVSFGGAGGAQLPLISTRKAKTQVSLKDGFTMGIGGLITSNAANGATKVPILGDIPILGYLFKQKTKNAVSSNLLIFITAKVVSAEGATVQQVFDPHQLKDLNIRERDLPGYREPNTPLPSDEKPKKSFFGSIKSDDLK
ncbi:MAG: secretin N-terminal domain-containing protein [Opitutaceae bacterium]|jgi:type IV pilus assembly protein PilQ